MEMSSELAKLLWDWAILHRR